jgi:hypothetical protein
MPKYYDSAGTELTAPDLTEGTLTPRKTVHHEAVPAATHEEQRELPGGMVLRWTATDTPAEPAYDEVTEYIYTPNPPSDLERVQAQATYTAMMTDTLMPESEG